MFFRQRLSTHLYHQLSTSRSLCQVYRVLIDLVKWIVTCAFPPVYHFMELANYTGIILYGKQMTVQTTEYNIPINRTMKINYNECIHLNDI